MYRSPIEMLITDIEHQIVKQQDEEIYQAVLHHIPNIDKEELIRALQYDRNQYEKGYADGVKEFSVRIAECLKRYSHLHKYANEARRREEEFADGTPMEMVSVWDVLPLEKWGMADYETMNTLQENIETIAKERLLTEFEKDFMLLVKEMVGADNA